LSAPERRDSESAHQQHKETREADAEDALGVAIELPDAPDGGGNGPQREHDEEEADHLVPQNPEWPHDGRHNVFQKLAAAGNRNHRNKSLLYILANRGLSTPRQAFTFSGAMLEFPLEHSRYLPM
jgi:hypothetical protein